MAELPAEFKDAIILEAYDAAANTFDIYASDQIASKRWQSAKGKRECDIRAETWRQAAAELREAARVKP